MDSGDAVFDTPHVYAVYLITLCDRVSGAVVGWYCGLTATPRSRFRDHLKRSNNAGVNVLMDAGYSPNLFVLADNLSLDEAVALEKQIVTGRSKRLPPGLVMDDCLNVAMRNPAQLVMFAKSAAGRFAEVKAKQQALAEESRTLWERRRLALAERAAVRLQGLIEAAVADQVSAAECEDRYRAYYREWGSRGDRARNVHALLQRAERAIQRAVLSARLAAVNAARLERLRAATPPPRRAVRDNPPEK